MLQAELQKIYRSLILLGGIKKMVKKRLFNTITTVALGLSLVGVANADTAENLMPKIKDSMESQLNCPNRRITRICRAW